MREIKFLKNLDRTSKDTLINLSGTVLIGVTGLFFYILAARYLGPSGFGLFSIAAAIIIISSDVFDFGTNTGIVKFISDAMGRNDLEEAQRIAKLAFNLKVFVGVAVVIIGFALAKFLAVNVLKQDELQEILNISFLGVLSLLLLSFYVSVLQSLRKFPQAILVNLSGNILRLVLVVILVAFLKLDVFLAILIFVATPLTGVILGQLTLPLKFFQAKITPNLTVKFLSFNKWIAFGLILAAIHVRLPNFLLIRFSTPVQTGLFSAASALILFAPQIVTALSVTFAPRFSQIKEAEIARSLFKKTFWISASFVPVGFLIILFAPLVLDLTVGVEYREAASIFQILVLSAIFLILSVPATGVVIYFFAYPQLFTIISALQVILVLALNLILIPKFQALGSAMATLVVSFLNFSLINLYAVVKLNKWPK